MSANSLLSLAGWYFLPGLVTGYAQSVYYAVFIRAGDPKPAPGSARFIRDRRRIHIAVIFIYLLYTVVDADYQLRLAGDFYQDLGIDHDATEKMVQSRFRRLTVRFHPDKASGPDRSVAEAMYVRLQVARDTLSDPTKRFAYDRLGPQMLKWRQARTIRDYVFTGIQNIGGYYIGTATMLVLLSVMGHFQAGKFWRYLFMIALFTIELYTMTRPQFPETLSKFINPILETTRLRPPYLPFQMLELLRKIAVTFFIAMSQLGPLLKGPQQAGPDGAAVSSQQVDRLEALSKATDQEITRLMGLEFAPFASEDLTMKPLRGSLKEWLIQNTIRNNPDVKGAMNGVFERRRMDGGAGHVPTG
ncbi:hypothetical protein Q7P37_004741 [Cladosporium fusiforme]